MASRSRTSWGGGEDTDVVLLRARVRRRDLLHRHHELDRSAALDAQSRPRLQIYAWPTSGQITLRGAIPRPVVSESPRSRSQEDVQSEEASARRMTMDQLDLRHRRHRRL